MPAPLIYLGIAAGSTLGAIVGIEAQERYNDYRTRRADVASQQETERRIQALRIAASEQAVREEAVRQGVDVEQVLADLDAGRQPRINEQQLMAVLEQALCALLSPQARAAINDLLAGVQS